MKVYGLLLLVSLTYGCSCGPAHWAEKAASQLRCGMSIEDIQRVTGREVGRVDPPREWVTHLIRDDVSGTDLRLGLADGKLQSVQLLWATRLQRMASYQRQDLCSN
jgi:hypothetical protein